MNLSKRAVKSVLWSGCVLWAVAMITTASKGEQPRSGPAFLPPGQEVSWLYPELRSRGTTVGNGDDIVLLAITPICAACIDKLETYPKVARWAAENGMRFVTVVGIDSTAPDGFIALLPRSELVQDTGFVLLSRLRMFSVPSVTLISRSVAGPSYLPDEHGKWPFLTSTSNEREAVQ